MDLIYPISYLVSLGALSLWFFAGSKAVSRKLSALFLFGFFVYLTALALSPGNTPYKLLVLLRDMVVMGVVSQLFNLFRKARLISIALALAAALTVYLSYFNTLKFTFPALPVADMYTGGEFLVQIQPGEHAVLDEMQRKFPGAIRQAFHPAKDEITDLDDYYKVDLRSDRKRHWKKFYHRWRKDPRVAWIEPNEVLSLDLPEAGEAPTATGRYFLNDPEIGRQWGFEPLDADALHRSIAGSGLKPLRIARIAILDTGVDALHEDINANYRSIRGTYDTDPAGHGTHCAGIAAAVSNNGTGIASLAPSSGIVEVSSIRVLNAYGQGTQKAIIDGIIEAVDAGVDVISVSLGGPSDQREQKAYRDAVVYAEQHNVIIVAAAGNANRNARTVTPANVEGVITVSAIGRDLRKAPFSNTVQDIGMAVAAPGVDIYSTLPGNTYGARSGTSMATPQVAGLITMMRSFRPDLTTKQAFDILNATGRKIPDGNRTGKLIQPLRAMEVVLD